VLPYTAAQWTRALEVIGHPEVPREPWFHNNGERSKRSDELYGMLAAALPARASTEWLEAFLAADIPCGRCNSPEDLLDDPHLQAVGFFEPNFSEPTPIRRTLRQPVLFRNTARQPDRPAPGLGADTTALLAELSYSPAEIANLVEAKFVGSGGRQHG
jgi:crotonobetainyl-CoA:carnitine CoA-transferase CaiB-like acyl-CoA transferase